VLWAPALLVRTGSLAFLPLTPPLNLTGCPVAWLRRLLALAGGWAAAIVRVAARLRALGRRVKLQRRGRGQRLMSWRPGERAWRRQRRHACADRARSEACCCVGWTGREVTPHVHIYTNWQLVRIGERSCTVEAAKHLGIVPTIAEAGTEAQAGTTPALSVKAEAVSLICSFTVPLSFICTAFPGNHKPRMVLQPNEPFPNKQWLQGGPTEQPFDAPLQ
jgi:hypothetical protein